MSTSPTTSIDLLERGTLFTQSERARFEELEVEIATRVEQTTRHKREAVKATLLSLREQAAWLFIEHQFEAHPTLEALEVGVEKEGDNTYVYVRTWREGDEEFNELGEDPEGLDEQIQMYLNDMGRRSHAQFHALLAEQSLERDHLVEASKEVLGEEWAAERLAQRLTEGLEPSNRTPKAPRM